MMPLGDEDTYVSSGVASSPRHALFSRRRSSIEHSASSNQVRHVHFSEHDLEETQSTQSTHHPTPVEAKQVIHNTSTRRLSVDEIELNFSFPTKFPPSENDYAVHKFAKRNDIIIAGALDFVKGPNFLGMAKTYWVEVYNGVMLVHNTKDVVDKDPAKKFITGCRVRILDMREYTLEVEHVYQQKNYYQVVKCQSKADVLLWWLALQLASVRRAGPMKQRFLSPLQLVEISNKVENTLFPRPTNTRRNSDRMSVTHLILVRHGEAENMHFRVEDREKTLTKRGQEQAKATAEHIAAMLKKAGAGEENVQLVYGGLTRTFKTAEAFITAMPWLKQTNECCLLEDGAPKAIEPAHRADFRLAMHRTAFECLCRHDPNEPQRLGSSNMNENYKILICHSSFVQHCLATTNKVSKEVIKIGAPIGHCSITQIDVFKDGDKPETAEVVYTNRVQHLKLTHRTSE